MTPDFTAWMDALKALFSPPRDYPVDPKRAVYPRSDMVEEMEEARTAAEIAKESRE